MRKYLSPSSVLSTFFFPSLPFPSQTTKNCGSLQPVTNQAHPTNHNAQPPVAQPLQITPPPLPAPSTSPFPVKGDNAETPTNPSPPSPKSRAPNGLVWPYAQPFRPARTHA
ncbi:hypothetical protein J3E74DRAFT_477932 [Bipolaris maydis]|nr:hypothetical protein J3E74DRAFT_477932 [Bipolaris maydis]